MNITSSEGLPILFDILLLGSDCYRFEVFFLTFEYSQCKIRRICGKVNNLGHV